MQRTSAKAGRMQEDARLSMIVQLHMELKVLNAAVAYGLDIIYEE